MNEWIVSRLLTHLRLSTPEVRALRLNRGIPGEELLQFRIGNRTKPIEEGLHLGSRCPVDPERKAIYDFLPRKLLDKVGNLPDLLMGFVFDKWVSQCDARQAIFVRERLPGETASLFRTYLIDHGLTFGGSRWEFSDRPMAGLFVDRSIYNRPELETIFHSTVDRIQELPEENLESIGQEVPADWLAGNDGEEVSRLIEALAKRRVTLHETIDRTLRQLEEAGIAVPRSKANRYSIGILVLTLLRAKLFGTHG